MNNTKKDPIRKNGFRFFNDVEPQDESETPLYLADQLAAVLRERERCASICEDGWKNIIGLKYQGDIFAEAIRKSLQN